MLSMEPQRTDYDVNFPCLGFQVRIHPLFWLAGLILGANGVWNDKGEVTPDAGIILLSWVSVLLVSILIHELGHSLVMRYFGQASHIVLYVLGGLAIPDSSFQSSFDSYSKPTRLSRGNHILISLAGPGAGFLLAGLTIVMIYALGGTFAINLKAFPYFGFSLPPESSFGLYTLISHLLYVNIFWGLVNLLPVFPLDGGQVSRQLFEQADPWNGFVRSLWFSIISAVIVAVVGGIVIQDRFISIMFVLLAVNNYMTLQQVTGGGAGGGRW